MFKLVNKRLRNRKGFTLIELVVVIAILGILALIAVPRFTGARDNAERSAVEANLRTIDSAISVFAAENGTSIEPTADSTSPTGLVPNYIASWPSGPGDATYAIDNARAVVSGSNVAGENIASGSAVTVENLPWN
jgi:type IV pilus assembly protein PilA